MMRHKNEDRVNRREFFSKTEEKFTDFGLQLTWHNKLLRMQEAA